MNDPHKKTVTIESRVIGAGHPCFVIAEIGTSHDGDRMKAAELVDAAAEAGADCVKTQAFYADEILHPLSGTVNLPSGAVSLFREFRRLERDIDFFREIKNRTENKGMIFLCAPFGLKSARMLRDLGVGAVKIASPELNHYPLLEAASFGVPLILSSGVSTLGDIEQSLLQVREPVILLHCVTAYPAPPEEYNLRCVENLGNIFGIPVGISDHSADPLTVPLSAVYWGAVAIEKHFTLRHSDGGLDDSFALEPRDFSEMVCQVRRLEVLPRKEQELSLHERFGRELFLRVSGDGSKHLSPSEKDNYKTTRRSLLALRDLTAGTRITAEDAALLRSEKNLTPGLGPEVYHIIMGKRLTRDVRSGTGISWEDLLQ